MASVTRDHSNHDLRASARQIIKGCEEFPLIKVEPLPDEPSLAHHLVRPFVLGVLGRLGADPIGATRRRVEYHEGWLWCSVGASCLRADRPLCGGDIGSADVS